MPETGHFPVTNSVSLYERHWPVDNPKANIVITHGFGEHCARYDHVAARFNQAGFSVYSYDLRGHGNSPGKMGTVNSFVDLAGDLDAYLTHLSPRLEGRPLFLYGHSMGGLVLANYTIHNAPQVAGLIFSAAGVKADESVSPLLQKVSGIMSAVLPGVPVHELDVTGISRVQEEVDKYVNDPLVYHGKINARTGHQMLTTMKYVEANMDKITQPFLAVHGKEDRVVKCDASEMLNEKAASSDKTLKLYDDGYHELHNDLLKDEVLDLYVDWIEKHL